MTTSPNAIRMRLCLITWLTDFAIILVMFSVSRNLAESGAGLFFLGLVGSSFSVGFAVSSALSGRVSDRLGQRKRVISVGLTMVAVGAVGSACLGLSQIAYYASYVLVGIGSGTVYPSIIAWLSQNGTERPSHRRVPRELIMFCIAWNVGLVCGQLTGGMLFRISPSWPPALAVALMACAGTILMSMGDHDARAPQAPVDDGHDAAEHRMRSAAFARLAWLTNLGMAFAFAMILHLFPKLAVSVGLPPHLHGAILAGTRAVTITTYLVLYRTSFWHHRFYVSVLSQSLAVLGLVVVACSRSVPGLVLGLLCLAQLAGYSYFASLYYSTSGSSDKEKGTGSGIHEATLAAGMTGGALCGGIVGTFGGERAPYVLAAAVIVALVLIQTWVLLQQRRRHSTAQR